MENPNQSSFVLRDRIKVVKEHYTDQVGDPMPILEVYPKNVQKNGALLFGFRFNENKYAMMRATGSHAKEQFDEMQTSLDYVIFHSISWITVKKKKEEIVLPVHDDPEKGEAIVLVHQDYLGNGGVAISKITRDNDDKIILGEWDLSYSKHVGPLMDEFFKGYEDLTSDESKDITIEKVR